ncbi:MAG: alanine--glyoxylate aminotransferase family protein [Gammaproteobacteria bacterium]|nr:alanine--glyoxylate aminotransferase family protein [Gammaproteobacteria bacterium]
MMYLQLDIPDTLAAGPGPGNTDSRVLQSFARAGVADHMQADVTRGMREAKFMLREVFGTGNTYTFAVGGTGFSGLDCAFSPILPGDNVVAFVNGTFSGIDDLAIRMKASTPADLAADPMNPKPANVITVNVPHGQSVNGDIIESALAEHKPMWAFMAHWETGSGRINDLQGFNDACARHGVMGIVDVVSSLGIADFNIDDYPAVTTWASCPQKGILALPLTYAPVSFNDRVIELLKQRGCYTYVHHPILEARHWSIIDGEDVDAPVYHRTHSGYAVASFHEALRLLLEHGRAQKAADYAFYEKGLRQAIEAMGCEVTSNMTSLVVCNLPGDLAGREKELVAACRAEGFGIWPTLSEPVQVRVGILNQLTEAAITDIVNRYADAMLKMNAEFDKDSVLAGLAEHLRSR